MKHCNISKTVWGQHTFFLPKYPSRIRHNSHVRNWSKRNPISYYNPRKKIPCTPSRTTDNNYRGRHVGRCMVQWTVAHAQELAKGVGCRFVVVLTVPSKVGFYQKCGFEVCPRYEKKRLWDKSLLFFEDYDVGSSSDIFLLWVNLSWGAKSSYYFLIDYLYIIS